MVIEADNETLKRIKASIYRGILFITPQDDDERWWENWQRKVEVKTLKIYITVVDIDRLSVGGSGIIIGENTIRSKRLHLHASGSSVINADLESDELEGDVSGSGKMALTGTAKCVEFTASGSADLNAENLQAEKGAVRASGSGVCRVYVKGELKTAVSGDSKIYYRGTPEKLNNQSSGSGTVRQVNR